MKRLEDLNLGDCFIFQNEYYVKLVDYRQNGKRCCANLISGSTRWINEEDFVEMNPIYFLNKDNNIVAIKPTEKQSDV